jgi:hypothetical protein
MLDLGFWICMGFFAFAIWLSIYTPIRNRKLADERWERWQAFQARVFPKPEEKKDKA